MNKLQKIIDNKDKIVGIRLNGVFYDVDCVTIDDVEVFDMLAPDDEIIRAYQLDENDSFIEYIFTVEDIRKSNQVVLYRLEEV